MTWSATEAALDGILARRWYTNQGPLARELEAVVADTTGVRHAVAVTNPTIGLVMLAEALDLRGDVTLSALAPMRCVQALHWAGLRPVFSDGALLGGAAVLFSRGAGLSGLLDRARASGLPLFSDGLLIDRVPAVIRLPGLGDAAGAGCVLTEDDGLAARLRNIRSSYGAGPPVPVRRTANGRLSEAQAAMSLLAWPPAPRLDAETLEAALGHEVLDLGDCVALVLRSAPERDRVLAAVPGAEAVVPSGPPGLCPGAEALAARLLILPPGMDLVAVRAVL